MADGTPEEPRTLADLRRAATDAHQSGDTARALRLYAAFLQRVPDDAGIWSNLGALHRSENRLDQAVRAHLRAYELTPDSASVLNNYANALSDIGRYDEALALRERLVEYRPDDAQQKSLIGRALRGKGQYRKAVRYLEGALAEHPDDAEIELQLAFALLGDGAYGDGFRHYTSRWRTGELKKHEVPFPKWSGEDLAGKTVLVMPEQGFGDAVLMMRFLPELKRRCGRVILLCEKPMFRLFAELEGADEVVLELSRHAPVDIYMNLMDLPRLSLETRDDIPAPARLAIPADSVERAQKIVAPYGDKFRVGVVWSGSATYKANHFRSFSHTDLLPLVDVEGVQLFSLYKGPFLEPYRADGTDAFILDAASTDRDFADCAATMQQMDLIVTSDTATAHIAGSLGLPVGVVLHWDSFWVYTHSGTSTPWYPSMRLFRQKTPRDWAEPIARVRRALQQAVRKGRADG
ncbi:hypothetical protein OG2516_11751 [Oceanicola granulosus HTCC2516]|uniref:Uncharacterized protein n=1 Tax=Oceanicola granulosus (strain ATCC BAA-861 / DSM 15982 / KCTC 12143 / HTCC2516) TaxID=314256 RepID=Q2CJK3_OCEGH|nr:tetratricopeptide repeat protein [Oceanicola granulosus]EAR53136.1 hypothetical protein OG2516_11751 [Oceanicola granulosus HTCC2516]